MFNGAEYELSFFSEQLGVGLVFSNDWPVVERSDHQYPKPGDRLVRIGETSITDIISRSRDGCADSRREILDSIASTISSSPRPLSLRFEQSNSISSDQILVERLLEKFRSEYSHQDESEYSHQDTNADTFNASFSSHHIGISLSLEGRSLLPVVAHSQHKLPRPRDRILSVGGVDLRRGKSAPDIILETCIRLVQTLPRPLMIQFQRSKPFNHFPELPTSAFV